MAVSWRYTTCPATAQLFCYSETDPRALQCRIPSSWPPSPGLDQGAELAWVGVACLVPHWLPGGSAWRIKPWSVLPTLYSPRTQTQSTPLACSVQLLLCRVCGPQLQPHPRLTVRDSQSRVPGKWRGTGTHPVQVSMFSSVKWDEVVGHSRSGCRRGGMWQVVFAE